MVSETQQESTSVHRCHCRILIGLEGAAEADGDQETFSNKYAVVSYPNESDICPREMRSRTCRSSPGARDVNVLENPSVRARESVFHIKMCRTYRRERRGKETAWTRNKGVQSLQ